MRSVEDLKAIASHGGGLTLDAEVMTVDDMKAIASYAKSGKARITIYNAAIFRRTT